MNLPNTLTLSRIPLMFVIALLLGWGGREGAPAGPSAAAALLFGLGALTDWLDGWLARRRGVVTNFGVFMDAVSDKVFMVGVMVVLAVERMVPVGLVLLILSREFLVTGVRLMAASKGVVVPAEKAGKHKTAVQMTAVGVLLVARAVELDVGRWVEAGGVVLVLMYAGIGLFVVATYLTVRSGVGYVVKYRGLLA